MKLQDCAATVIAGKLTKTYPEQEIMLSEKQTSLYTQNRHRAEIYVSEVLESHRIPDPYIWKFNKFSQFIPENDPNETPIENIIIRNNYIGEIEYQAFLKIQNRAYKMDDGYVLWISPIHPVYYPEESKIIVSKKDKGILLNHAIGTDWNAMETVLIAQELATISDINPSVFRNTTDVRANPIFIDKSNEEYLAETLKKILSKKVINMMQTGEDWSAKERYINDYLAGKSIQKGDNPLSCPIGMETKSAFHVFANERRILCCKCPFCGKEVKAEIYDGEIHCPPDPEGCGQKAQWKN